MEQNLILYKQCLAYAFKLDPILYRDLVHDAFITWFEKTGKNLFEEENKTAIAVVKRKWWQFLKSTRIKIGGQRGYYNPWTGESRNGKRGTLTKRFADVKLMELPQMRNNVTPEDEYIAKELHEQFLNVGGGLRLEIYKLAVMGYKQVEIASILDERPNLINYYFKQMRWMVSIWN